MITTLIMITTLHKQYIRIWK